ncbi:MAG: hypothetical protein GX803_03325 [Lentisphaerae bacterium]|nr:hypothetical protein [Lentisphaerota bacterium]
MNPTLKRVIWLLNTAGFVFYLVWLATMSNQHILREQDGIVYFLPVIPFFFVYMLLFSPKPPPPSGSPTDSPPDSTPDSIDDHFSAPPES